MKSLRRYSCGIVFILAFPVLADTSQEGSLNTNTENSTVSSNNVTGDSTTNNYNGAGSSSDIPAASAMSPSYLSSGLESCLRGSAGSLQTGIVGISAGRYKEDEDCNRRRDAKMLFDLGMKVAGIGRLCQDKLTWEAMFASGTPCPIIKNGKLIVGKRAYLMIKTMPELYIPNYKEKEGYYNQILNIGGPEDEKDDDIISVSGRFRRSQSDR